MHRILLFSPDLMVASRLAGLAGGRATIETSARLDAVQQGDRCDLVLVDLQALAADPAEIVSRARGFAPAKVVAFGPHVAKSLLEAAREAGADDVVSRGELLGNFPALVDRWCG